ncbi:MAG: LysR family transcriptional regulator [Opitutaceae bacterium]|nr:LysR family transcriptional regulator [Opitutaceae bacterium]
MNYTLRELECFLAAAEELSFTRAARRLRLAQPPLSRHIRTLEDKLGTALFRREARRVSLTAAGTYFYEQTRTVPPQLVRAEEATRRFAAGQTDRLRLGFVSAVLSPEWMDLVRTFREQHPAVQITVQDSAPTEQLEALRAGNLDGGFVGLAPQEPLPGLQTTPWRKELLAAFVPFGHRLAAHRTLRLTELAGEPWVAVSSAAAPVFAAHVRDLCARAGFRPRVVMESHRAQAVAVMVAAGTGVAVLPTSLARIVGPAALVIPLTPPSSVTHVFARVAGPPGPALRAFLRLLAGTRAAGRTGAGEPTKM